MNLKNIQYIIVGGIVNLINKKLSNNELKNPMH